MLYYPDEIKERVAAGKGCGSQIRKGWYPLLIELDKELSKIVPDYKIDQVKEKFGGLRFYIGSVNASINDSVIDRVCELIREAEEKSYTICDICGETGSSISLNGWYVTRCEKHANKESQ